MEENAEVNEPPGPIEPQNPVILNSEPAAIPQPPPPLDIPIATSNSESNENATETEPHHQQQQQQQQEEPLCDEFAPKMENTESLPGLPTASPSEVVPPSPISATLSSTNGVDPPSIPGVDPQSITEADPLPITEACSLPITEAVPVPIAETDSATITDTSDIPIENATSVNDLVKTNETPANADDDDGNLLEASSYQPREDESSSIISNEASKRKHTSIGEERFKKSIKKKKTGQNFFDASSVDDDDDMDDGEDEDEEDDDDFDEDDDEEFEIERQQRLKAAAEGFQKEYESDVDSLGDISDEDDVEAILKHKSIRPGMSTDSNTEALNLNDILAEGGINLDKTVQLEDLMDNPEEMELDEGVDAVSSRRRHDQLLDGNEDFEHNAEDDDIDMDYELTQKLKDMGEISLEPLAKNDSQLKRDFDLGDEVSLEITKKSGAAGSSGSDTEDKRKITNLRKNIREVMDDNQLDASTLAAQRQELERLARVQDQQRMIRDAQRQIAMERQNSKTQNRVLSLLQGKSGMGPSTSSLASLIGPARTKTDQSSESLLQRPGSSPKIQSIHRTNLTPSVSIAPVRPPASTQKRESSSEVDDDFQPILEESSPSKTADASIDSDTKKKDVVTIVDSSDDDCIMLSDDEEEPEDTDDPHNSGLHVNDAYNVPDEQGRIVVNIGHPEGEADIFVAPQIARTMKPHQIGGVRFLFDNIIESVDRFNSSTGFGCILAHSMGLGKTIQLVCFCDIFLRHTSSKTILCIMPINTLQNWMAEFNMWLPDESEKHTSKSAANGEEVRCRNFNLFVLNDNHKTLTARSKVILDWAKNGGVLLMGYELYRLLSMKKVTKKRGRKVYRDPEVEKEEAEEHMKLLDEMHAALVKPGPDLCVCDEGHRIKNSHAGISIALKQMRSKRRIVLTGYPLQNNLLEYWCMVDFVRPNYLGTKTEFCNMFERPIQNGQCIDSTPQDIKLMRYRAHVLHSLLLGFVQRRSHVVLQNSLPVKEEFVLLVRMTEFQRKLYEVFMNEVVRTKAVPNPLKAFAVCCKIWNHPDVLYNFLKKREADLDLEEAEAAANDATFEPLDSSTTTTPGKKGKKAAPAAKEKKAKGPKGKKTTEEVIVPTPVPPPPTPEVKAEVVPAPVEEKPIPISTSEVKKETTIAPPAPEPENSYQQHPQPPYNPYPPPPQENYNYNNYDYYNNQYPNSYNNPTYPNYNQPQGYQSHFHQPLQPIPPHHHGHHNQYPPGDYWNQSNTHHNNYYSNNEYTQQYNQYHSGYSNDYQHGGNYSQQYPQQHQQYPHQQHPPPADPWSTNSTSHQDVKPTTMNDPPPTPMHQTNAKVDTKFGNLDTKEIKIENPMSLNLEIAKIEDKSAIKLEIAKSNDTISKDPITPTTKAEPSTPEEKPTASLTNTGDDVKEESSPSNDAKDNTVKTKSEDGIPYDWAVELMKNYVPDLIENSPKMEIFFCILEESLKLKDRLLVFSQSLLTLNLIEKFLQANYVTDTDVRWAKNLNYYRLDGSTAAMEREKLINEFNVNLNVHLFLVSTRAGSLGINLVGANRVVVFDASWNPCHDTQAVCRVYRYGQQKPCFVYRLVMDSCLEKKIYDRQVNKQGMSDRVVDESNPDAHLSMKEVTNLCYDDDKESEMKDFSDVLEKYTDVAVRKIITKFSKLMTKEPFQHETLLIDRKEKKLSMAEKRLAQRGYELEKQAALKPNYLSPGTQYRTVRTPDGAIVHRPVASVRPMQADLGVDRLRTGINRATRWIPAEVWQRQGLTAQVLTLPGDVVIPTSSAEKSNIVLKEGQKVMVLKSPKGIYMQLESGKIIAIRTAFKMGQPKDKLNPTGLIGRDFTPKRLTTGAAATSNPTSPVKPLVGAATASAVVPMSLKNNSSISITSNKTGIGPRIPNLPLGHQARGTSGPVRPYGGASTGTAGARPVSLLNNKPRPMIMQKGLAGNKSVQLGTARPYNLKQIGGRVGPGPASSKIPPSYTMSSSSSNSNSSFDVDSIHHEDSSYYMAKNAATDADDDVTEIIDSTEIVDSDGEKSSTEPIATPTKPSTVRSANSNKGQVHENVKSASQDDDVIMVDQPTTYGSSGSNVTKSTNLGSSTSTTNNTYNKPSLYPGVGLPATQASNSSTVDPPVVNQPYYGYDTTTQGVQPFGASSHQPQFEQNPVPSSAQQSTTTNQNKPTGQPPLQQTITSTLPSHHIPTNQQQQQQQQIQMPTNQQQLQLPTNQQHQMSNQNLTSSNQNQTPTNQHQMPNNQHQMPNNQHQMSANQHQISANQHQMPTNQHQMPTNQHQIPSNPHQMSTNQHQMSTNQHQMSTNQHQMPTNQHQMPTNQHQMPINPHQMPPHQSLQNANPTPYPYHAVPDPISAQPHISSHSYPYPAKPPTESTPIGHMYPYSATGSVVPPVSKPSSILIDDDHEPAAQRDKGAFKQSPIDRKSKATKKETTKPNSAPYSTPNSSPYSTPHQDFRSQQNTNSYVAQKPNKDIEKPAEPLVTPLPQLHQPYLSQPTSQQRYPGYSHPYANQPYNHQYPNSPMNIPNDSMHPSTMQSISNSPTQKQNNRNKNSSSTSNNSAGHHNITSDNYGIYEPNTPSGHFSHIHGAAHQPLHPHPINHPHGMPLDHQHQPEPSSLSFLERTASSIQEHPSAFNMSLNDITKPPVLDQASIHSGSSNSNSAPSPAMSGAPAIQTPDIVTPSTKSKAKPRSKAAPASKKPTVPKTPVEPKVAKEKPPPKNSSKKNTKNTPIPAVSAAAPDMQPADAVLQHTPTMHPTGSSSFQQTHHQQPDPPLSQQHQTSQQSHNLQHYQQQPQHQPPQSTPPPQHQPQHSRPSNPPSNGSAQHPPNNLNPHHLQQSYHPTSSTYPNYGHPTSHYPSGYSASQTHPIPPTPPSHISTQAPPPSAADTYGSLQQQQQTSVSSAPQPPSTSSISHQSQPYDSYNMGYPGYHPAPGMPHPGPVAPLYQPPMQYDQMYGNAPLPPQSTAQHHQSSHQHKLTTEEHSANVSSDPSTSAAAINHSHTSTSSTTTDPHQSYANSNLSATTGYSSHPIAHHQVPAPYANHHSAVQPTYLPPTGVPYHNYPPPVSAYPPAIPPSASVHQGYNYGQPAYGGPPTPAFGRSHHQQAPVPQQPQQPPPTQQPQPGAYPPIGGLHDNPYGGYPPHGYQNYPPYGTQPGQW